MSEGPSLRVAVLSGGRSSEHEVSLASGASVASALRDAGHEVVPVEISREGTWLCEGERLSPTPGEGLLGVDVAFPALHGPYGEDGTIQGMLETLDVAYVGADVAASALCMDKVLFKRLMSSAGAPQVDYEGVRRPSFERSPAGVLERLSRLGTPVFVKPAHLGSSVGIAKVGAAGELRDALERAFVHDELVIVEAMAPGLEIECGVLGAPADERASASVPGEIAYEGDWYDYEAKYTPGGMELVVPARITASAAERVRELALEAFELSGCEGLARVDFFVDVEQVLLNELNTMPGFTPTSVYAKLFEASGVTYARLVEQLCLLGIERHRARNAYAH